uniref:AlNc14C201G8688 protein n=1 Tax=Albugo laibachii Nc14 TaxID=890382 RepID=F0WQM6_9STRA|nr:AlNc14C201G8688 [Albugo laibachii Nc14]|eukprot:CCA23635.1 AlNc14C201G8688 [Albugo laibachii Nc14]
MIMLITTSHLETGSYIYIDWDHIPTTGPQDLNLLYVGYNSPHLDSRERNKDIGCAGLGDCVDSYILCC